MNTQENASSTTNVLVQPLAYSAPAVLSAVKITDIVRGGSGFASDGGNFLPL
jgi:hypothetical protein